MSELDADWDPGGFDEQYGIHYDGGYSAACISQGLPPILPILNTPVLHLQNQSQDCSDPSFVLWNYVNAAFAMKYGIGSGGFRKDKGRPI